MDLNSFINGDKEKTLYKITFLLDEEKIKRFVYAYSKDNAKYQFEQDIKKEHPDKKVKIVEIKLIEKKTKVIS